MMLKNWIVALLFIIPFSSSLNAYEEESDEQYKEYVYEIVDLIAERMEEEFNLQLIKWGGAFRDYLKYGIAFNAFRRATLDEARALESIGWMILGKKSTDVGEIRGTFKVSHHVNQEEARLLMLFASQRLLRALNDSKVLKPYLKEYPFPASRLKLRILFRGERLFVGEVSYYDGTLESVVLNENIVTYSHYVENLEDKNFHDLVICGSESYQEAQTLTKERGSSMFLKKIWNVGQDVFDKMTYFFQGIIFLFLILYGFFTS